ncbi:alpha-ketoglutarate-dependent dioxygenase alkB homolog 3 isoform X1 [Ailuropoda melanoleuca]|uniref:alpha-ketoglutarate-dependent dioxygenase alkB homolog 3 isoform X1 n=1 Tax=Ailuropoda melanoleuca TaxID=9646 RepID=UPI0009483551|nr:alpha-ketoglutarate-dependent dioxygenase alkB homolog 3 isoform X1 [Ailuropoda melanoleuca]XP_019665472.1 alpha-ketoglutarate-dependent dioxygenase alkB homolog 3 isoform X1 [Ailuropoda melanoleuca]XP_019665473.1 alpha-ketoglutarate-dependent dioxygenase alkB homolog 3 isoform X1 [Ailuropoda melanoleuca]XP_034500596.1 alpha-ketoglutarate-dependent dioxygenase alkB homolog 3 isoform X1 [Ailuropoda melanoleuca]
MEDKRRRARVQGAWAGPAKSQAAAQQAATAQSHLHQRPGQTWMNKEHHLVDRQFVFREPQQVVRRPPAPRVIDKEGVYEISVSPTGISRVCLYPGFIDLKEANWVLEQLCEVVPWKQRTGIRDGPVFSFLDVTYKQPRLTAWYGELPYTYSRITMEPNPHWHPVLRSLKDQIEENTGHTFNSLLCNLYRNEKDSVDWHSDDEPSLGRCPVIASLSFGATRTFEMRRKPPPEENGDYTYVERVKIPLDHGTLLIMEGATQADWQHRVPKEYHSREPRINLTFRTVYPDPGGAHW